MFTGIITAIGEIREATGDGAIRATITCPYPPETMAIGASIACSGVCLTVVARGGPNPAEMGGDAWFTVDISGETIARSVPGRWRAGARLNLEQAMKLGDELGGHIVTGHVDGVGVVRAIAMAGGSRAIEIAAPPPLAPYIATKGSITLDGVSLTVNGVDDTAAGDCHFMVTIIPHTARTTTLGALAAGDAVNLEIDVLARYLRRMQSLRN